MRIFRTPYNYNSLINVLLAFLLLFGSPQVVQAETLTYSVETAPFIIEAIAAHHGISAKPLLDTIYCESKYKANTIGDHGTSFGAVQIHLPAHPDITKEQALDPLWSINWMAEQFKAGKQKMWSCYKEELD